MLEVDTLQTSYIGISFLVFTFLIIFLNITGSAIKACSLTTFKMIILEYFLYFLLLDAS